jgi:phosphoglycolate phosphatase-like HAD superfamily hydrolase
MRLAELDAVTIDAYGTLVRLRDPVPALRAGLAQLGVEREPAAVARAFAKETAYYRERSFEGRDDETLYELRRRCVAIILDELRSELAPEAFVDGFVAAIRFELLPGVEAALAALRRRGLAVAVVSNWDFALPRLLEGLGLTAKVVGSGGTVTDQLPAPNAFVAPNSQVIIYAGATKPSDMVAVPELYGKSFLDAKRTLESMGLFIKYHKKTLPHFVQWKQMGYGTYTLGLEPANCHVGGRAEERAAGSLTVLQPGEQRNYRIEIGILDGIEEMEEFTRAIHFTA